jgi:myo-inositol-1(or 4)-monophosphatase
VSNLVEKHISEENVINKAIIYAVNAHRGTYRKGSSTPYILHPIEAATIVSTMTNDCSLIAAALLHDVIEDTEITYEDLKQEFGLIADLVEIESENKRKNKPPEETWHIRKKETIEFFMNKAQKESKIIALGDKLSNMRSIYRDYQAIGDDLWEKFHEKNKTEQGWYYKSMVEALKDLKEYQAYQEFKRLVYKVF